MLLFFSLASFSQVKMKYKIIQPGSGFVPDSARFNFNPTGYGSAVSGWIDVKGDPYASVLSGTQNGYTVSTLGTGGSYWQWNGTGSWFYFTPTVNITSEYVANLNAGGFFNASTSFISGGNLRITVPASGTYTIVVGSHRPGGSDNRLTKIACIDNGGTETISDINSSPTSNNTTSTRIQVNNGGTVYYFTGKVPNGSNYIFLGICAASGYSYGYINWVKIIRTS